MSINDTIIGNYIIANRSKTTKLGGNVDVSISTKGKFPMNCINVRGSNGRQICLVITTRREITFFKVISLYQTLTKLMEVVKRSVTTPLLLRRRL